MLRGRRLYAEKPCAYARLAARAFSGVGSAARGDFEGVLEQGENRGQALFRGAAAAGKVDDERAASEPSHGAREPGEGILLGAQGAHGFGQAGGFAVDDPAGGLGGAVARTEAGAADGEDQRSAVAVFPEYYSADGGSTLMVSSQVSIK